MLRHLQWLYVGMAVMCLGNSVLLLVLLADDHSAGWGQLGRTLGHVLAAGLAIVAGSFGELARNTSRTRAKVGKS